MKKYYIELKKELIEVYEVEATSEKEAKELVKKNNNRFAPNIVDRKNTENLRNVSGMYENGKLIKQFRTYYT